MNKHMRQETPKTVSIVVCAVMVMIADLTGWLSSHQASGKTQGAVRTWTFDTDAAGTLPTEFQVGTLYDGRPAGEWTILAAKEAVSPPQVLAQLMNKGAEHAYKVVLTKEVQARDIDLQVSFLAVAGKGDMGGGVIWRAADDRNYYLTRANPLEQNIRLYHVTKGVRKMIKNVDQTIDVHQWHRLRVKTEGCRIQVFYDDRPVLDDCDRTFMEPGRIGLWTKSDAVTYFDDLLLSEAIR
jgi:hypothetical protein